MKQITIQQNPHVSVDCVVFGFDGVKLHVVLVEKTNIPEGVSVARKHKLPGRLILTGEDPDEAARDVLETYTGISRQRLEQFHTFGSPSRMANQEDLEWIRNESGLPIDMVISVAYMAAIRISTKLRQLSSVFRPQWHAVDHLPELAFDNTRIVQKALLSLRKKLSLEPDSIFKLLPRKFTIQELRRLHETILGEQLDIRNFHKKVKQASYIEPLDEWESHVMHRAARYYRFSRKKYQSSTSSRWLTTRRGIGEEA